MSTHLVSMLLNYRLGPNPSKSDCTRLMTEFQKEFRSSFDFAFIGEIDNIADYSLKLLAANLDAAPLSLPADLLKHESIMSILHNHIDLLTYSTFNYISFRDSSQEFVCSHEYDRRGFSIRDMQDQPESSP